MEEERLITCEKIEQWAEDLLTLCLVAKEGKEHEVWLATYHLFCGLKMFDFMSADDREKVRDVYDKTKGMFDFKLILKDKKTKKAEIKNNTPAPQDKNKEENKEEKKKTKKKI